MIIGIDPGKQTGICFINENKNILDLYTTYFWGAADLIYTFGHKDCVFILEKPQSKNVWHKAKDKRQAKIIGANVGSVYREAELLEELLKQRGCKYKTVHPQGKINAENFKKITGYEGKTNQHERDAAMLCWVYLNGKP